MQDVWGTGTNDVYAVGWDGRIIHWNGSIWSLQSPPATTNRLEAVAAAGSKVFAVGTGGVIVETNDGGTTWSQSNPTTVQLNDVWAADANNAWAVGDGGVILRYTSGVWASTPPNALETRSFRGVWGTSTSDVFAVGQGGMIYHFDGTGWTAETSNTTQTLQAVAGTSTTQVVAGGSQGTYLRRIATGPTPQWIPQPVPTSETLQGIWFASPTDAVIVTSNATTIPQTGTILRGTP